MADIEVALQHLGCNCRDLVGLQQTHDYSSEQQQLMHMDQHIEHMYCGQLLSTDDTPIELQNQEVPHYFFSATAN